MFQCMMDHITQGMGRQVYWCLIVFSKTWEDHLLHLQTVLSRLQTLGLTAKSSKCQFSMTECIYLGHIVGNGVVRPKRGKFLAVAQFLLPATKKQVHSFLGLSRYYRCFIPNYATIAAPITDLTQKSVPENVSLGIEGVKSFSRLKEIMLSYAVLRNPYFTKPFIIQTDASEVGVGAILSQQDTEGYDNPVAFFSRKLLLREQRFSTVEKECLAVKLGVEAFQVYLLGRKFVIQTDHRALQWLTKFKNHNSRLMRWSLALNPYLFQVQHRKGTDNANADALS